MWVLPDGNGIDSGYEQLEIAPADLDGQFAVVATGMDRNAHASAIRIRNTYAALHAARLQLGASVTLPVAHTFHPFVPRGAVARGKASGGVLVRGALDHVHALGLRVLPVCPFVQGWMARHLEYADLADLDYRSSGSAARD